MREYAAKEDNDYGIGVTPELGLMLANWRFEVRRGNRAAFWDGAQLSLTPAYDLCRQLRSGETASQALTVTRTPDERASQLWLCRKAAPDFLLSDRHADQIIEAQLEVISREWDDDADEAQLTKAERSYLWQRQILNPDIHYNQV